MNPLEFWIVHAIDYGIRKTLGPFARKSQQKHWDKLSPEQQAEILEHKRKFQEKRQKERKTAFFMHIVSISFAILGICLVTYSKHRILGGIALYFGICLSIISPHRHR